MKFICCCSGAKSCPTFCNTMDCSLPGFPVLHHLLEFTQTHVHWVSDATQPSHPLLPPSHLTLNLSQHQDLFQRVSSSHQVAKVLELQYKVNKPVYCVPYIFTKALSPQSFDVNTCAISHLLFVTQYFPNTNRACTGLDLGFIGSLKKDILKDTDVHDLNLGMGFTRWHMYKNRCFSSYRTVLFPTVHSNSLDGKLRFEVYRALEYVHVGKSHSKQTL